MLSGGGGVDVGVGVGGVVFCALCELVCQPAGWRAVRLGLLTGKELPASPASAGLVHGFLWCSVVLGRCWRVALGESWEHAGAC